MLLTRFLNYFYRVQPATPEATVIRFEHSVNGVQQELTIRSIMFDAKVNTWVVELRAAHSAD